MQCKKGDSPRTSSTPHSPKNDRAGSARDSRFADAPENDSTGENDSVQILNAYFFIIPLFYLLIFDIIQIIGIKYYG